MKLSSFAQDVTKAEQGVWIDIGDGCRVKVARTGSAQSNKVLAAVSKPFKQSLNSGAAPDSLVERLYAEHASKAILLGWEGLQDDQGADIPYSQSKAFEILSNPMYRDFKDNVFDLARQQETFRKDEINAAVGKSQDS